MGPRSSTPVDGRVGAEFRAGVVRRLVAQHHAFERRALPYITSLLPKVAGRWRSRDERLDALCDAGEDLAEALDTYLDEDERTLLPAVARGASTVARSELRRHVDEVAVLLANVRVLSGGFRAPEWGDASYQALMEELEALEDDVLDRLHVERHALLRSAEP